MLAWLGSERFALKTLYVLFSLKPTQRQCLKLFRYNIRVVLFSYGVIVDRRSPLKFKINRLLGVNHKDIPTELLSVILQRKKET